MPNPSVAVLENVVRSHLTQLTKLNAELVSAFSQVTEGESPEPHGGNSCAGAQPHLPPPGNHICGIRRGVWPVSGLPGAVPAAVPLPALPVPIWRRQGGAHSLLSDRPSPRLGHGGGRKQPAALLGPGEVHRGVPAGVWPPHQRSRCSRAAASNPARVQEHGGVHARVPDPGIRQWVGWQRPPERLSSGPLRGDQRPSRAGPAAHLQRSRHPHSPSGWTAPRAPFGAGTACGGPCSIAGSSSGGALQSPPGANLHVSPATCTSEDRRTHAAGSVAPVSGDQGTAHARPTLPVLREGGAHHLGLPGSAKIPGSLGRGVLVSRADFIPPSGGTNSLFPAILAWGLETLSVGALLDSGADECLIDVTLARQAGPPRTHGCYPICTGARRSLHG